MDIFLGKVAFQHPELMAENLNEKTSGDATGYELCHKACLALAGLFKFILTFCRSGVTITAGYAIKQSARLLKVVAESA